MENEELSPVRDFVTPKRRSTQGIYTSRSVTLKLEIAEFAVSTSLHQAAKKYQCDRKSVRSYIAKKREYEELAQSPGKLKRLRLPGGGRKLTYPDMEERLAEWVTREREKKNPVSRTLLRIRAIIEQEELVKKIVITESWIDRFMDRHGFSLRRKTTVCQKDPEQLVPKIVEFIFYVRNLRIDNHYSLSDIIACDETPVWLDFASETTIYRVGAKEICVKTTGHEKCKISVMLTTKAEGTKLKPHVIINRVRPIDSLKKYNNKLFISYAKKSWFDDELTSQYLKNVVRQGFFNKRRLLVWDSFRCHIIESTKSVCKSLKLDMAVIPGGTTKYIQPADVSWNKAFKNKLKCLYTSWLISGEKNYTKGGNVKSVDFFLICQWIIDSWESVSKDCIVNSFKHCGITNAIDGSEDQLVTCMREGHSCVAGREMLKQKSVSMSQQRLVECPEEDEENYIDDNENLI